MKLTRIEGPAVLLRCIACNTEGIGGTEAYTSASTGERVIPDEDWYTPIFGGFIPENGPTYYCAGCAAKMVQEDPTRSITKFYSDTEGKEIAPENLSSE
jgi:hypothetical protein